MFDLSLVLLAAISIHLFDYSFLHIMIIFSWTVVYRKCKYMYLIRDAGRFGVYNKLADVFMIITLTTEYVLVHACTYLQHGIEFLMQHHINLEFFNQANTREFSYCQTHIYYVCIFHPSNH